MKKIISLLVVLAMLMAMVPAVFAEDGVTISFDNTDNRTSFSETEQVWEQNGITVTNEKASSTNNVADYSNPIRCYKGSSLTVAYSGMTAIAVTCGSSSYATALKDSISDDTVTVSVDGSVVTITLPAAADSYSVAALGAQVRIASITVYTTAVSGGEDDSTQTSFYAPADGDKVKVYYPDSDNYITATASGSKLSGGDADAAAVLTVTVDANGYYTFVSEAGKYLTSGATGNSLSFADEASDYSLWTLEEAENGWYIKSVNAAYNGNGQYIEYYYNFTTYGFNSSKANIYTFQFVKVEESDVHVHDESVLMADEEGHYYGCTCGYVAEDVAKEAHIDDNADYACDSACGWVLAPEADSTLTIPEASALGVAHAHNAYTTGKYYVTGTVTGTVNESYGNLTIVDDDGNTLYVYGLLDENGTKPKDGWNATLPVEGDEITVYAVIGQYNGTAQAKNATFTINVDEVTGPTLVTGDNYLNDTDTYTYTVEQTGTLYLTVNTVYCNEYPSEISYVGQFVDLTVNDQALENVYYGSLAVTAGDVITVKLTALDSDSYAVDLNLNYEGFTLPEPGTEENPYELNYADCPATTVEIPAGTAVWYQLGYDFPYDGYLTVTGENAYVSYSYFDWSQYMPVTETVEAENGVVTIPMSAYLIQIGNSGTEAASFVVDCFIPLGTSSNPDTLIIGENSVELPEGNSGYIYQWVAEEEGTLTVVVSGEKWAVNVTNWGTSIDDYDGDTYFEIMLYNANPLVDTVEIPVKAGEIVEVKVETYDPAGMWGDPLPAGSATLNVSFVAGEIDDGNEDEPGAGEDDSNTGTLEEPVVIVLPFVVDVDGIYDNYYVWTAIADGTVTVIVPEGGLLSLPNGETWEAGEVENSYVIDVTEGDVLVFNLWTSVGATGTNSITFESGEVDSGDDVVVEIPEYENVAEIEDDFTLTVGEDEVVEYVDITEEHTAVLGDDGYYHLDSADGEIIYVDLDYIMGFEEVITKGYTGLVYIYIDGVKTDCTAAVQEYLDAADENGYYPLTADLMFFYQAYGESQLWYNPDMSFLVGAELLPENLDPETGWMYACLTVVEKEVEEPTETPTETPDDSKEDDTNPETADAVSVAVAALLVSAMSIVALPAVKKFF